MVIIIDNYDSFSYNLFQYAGELADEVKVIRNDAISCEELAALKPTHLILSPGPGRPEEAGICEEAVRYFEGKLPILGVCLGHQAICEAYGARIINAPRLMHGKQSLVRIRHIGGAAGEASYAYAAGNRSEAAVPGQAELSSDAEASKSLIEREAFAHARSLEEKAAGQDIFAGLAGEMIAGRYHSLSVEKESLPEELELIAWTPGGEVMGVKHKDYPTWGLQFHPESILTPEGKRIMENFLTDQHPRKMSRI